jgi:hypothetical protein
VNKHWVCERACDVATLARAGDKICASKNFFVPVSLIDQAASEDSAGTIMVGN